MPIVGSIKKGNLRYEYKMPNRIKNLCTNSFLIDFKNNLDKIFNKDNKTVFVAEDYEQLESTCGWQHAFDNACNSHEYIHIGVGLKRYCNKLTWYDYDLFCDELCQLMIKELDIKRDNDYWNYDDSQDFKYKMKRVRKCDSYIVYEKLYEYEEGFDEFKGDEIYKY